jgi:hypothetical protein
VSQATEFEVLKLKPRASRMFLPTLVLAGVCFGLAFFADVLSDIDYYYALILGGVIVGVFWLVPLLSFALVYLKLTNQRLIYRFGFLGLRKRQLRLADLSSIEIQKSGALAGKVISILSVDGTEFRVEGYARTKLLAAEIEALAKAAI